MTAGFAPTKARSEANRCYQRAMADVLVVDSGELGELLAALLGQYGMEASRARSGEEALERALNERPRVAIIEHDLPDVAGVDVAELLRTELDTKVILTYAQGLVVEADEALLPRLAAMDASFARPFRSLTLVEEAARLLGVQLRTGAGSPGVTAPPERGAATGAVEEHEDEDDDEDEDLDDDDDEDGGLAEQRRLSSMEGAPVDDSADELVLDVVVTPARGVASPYAPAARADRDAAETRAEGAARSVSEEDLALAALGGPRREFPSDEITRPGFVINTGEAPPASAAGPAPPLEELLQSSHTTSPVPPGSLGDLWLKVKARRSAPSTERWHTTAPGSEAPLSPRALADMLDAFHQSQTTGELWLSHDKAKRVLLLRRGVIVGARSNIDAEELTMLALKKGLLPPQVVGEVRMDVIDGRKRTVVEAIAARGLLDEARLRSLVEEHARRIALGAFTWQTGGMRVTLEGRAGREHMPVRVSVGDIIVRGILLTEGDEALRAAAPDDARFSPAADSGYGLEDLTLSADEARAVVAMDGTKTVRDLITLFAPVPSERTIRGLAAGLLCLHLVRFVGRGPAEARRISFF